ncbi:MAG: S8 family serine peptidase [Rhodocyclales bacterium]|nr:S8 family serine peptidase [Rhodocyclales bacterium]
MTWFRANKMMGSRLAKLAVTFIVSIFLSADFAYAQIPGSISGKPSLPQGVQNGRRNITDFIVVYDDKAIQKESKQMQVQMGFPSHHQQIIDHKANRYSDKKREIHSTFGSHEITVVKEYSHLPLSFVRVHSKNALARLLSSPGVASLHEDRVERLALAESLPLIWQSQAYAQGYQGTGTAVAVLDTGVDYTQPAFGSCSAPGVPTNCKVVYAQDFAPNDGQRDNNGHGTNVAGIVAGVAPGTKIIALDVFRGSTATGDLGAAASDVIAAINWVIASKATYNTVAMNLSLGSSKYTSPITSGDYYAAIANARAAGILTIAAAGNNGYTNALSSPGAVQGVVSVGAVYDSSMGTMSWGLPSRCQDIITAADKVTCFSNSASFLTLLAPGSQIIAAGITESGTSQASPHVAGATAVIRSAFPNESLDQTVARLTNGIMVIDSRNDIAKPRLYLPTALGLGTPCTYAISETSRSFTANSATGSISVTAGANCTWSAASSTSSASWLSVNSGNTGNGSGIVTYSVLPNTNAASRTGTLTVAGQAYTVTQSGSTGTTINILANPGFETGPVSWVSQTANGYPIITAYDAPVANNSWYAWLCGYDGCVDNLYQDVTIPASTQSAYLQFSYWIKSAETSPVTAYDSMMVRIYSLPSSSVYTLLSSFSNLNVTTGWFVSPRYDVSAFRGQTIRLQFSATTDSSFATSFYLDDVVLNVTGATPDTQAPTVPAGLISSPISGTAIRLTWAASADNVGVASYRVYRDGTLIATLGNVLNYTDSGLVSGSSHSYTILACDAAGNCSTQSTAVTTTASVDTQPPTVPTLRSAISPNLSSVAISWSASTDNVGVTAYRIFRNGVNSASVGNVTSYTDTGLNPATPYSYTVAACDAVGNCSAQSMALSAVTLTPVKQASYVTFVGSVSEQVTGSFVNIKIASIANTGAGHSGSLRIELWALTSPYYGGSVNGYVTASIRTSQINGLSDYMPPSSTWSSINLNLPYAQPPSTYKQYSLFLLQYDLTCTTADHFCIYDYLNLHDAQAPTTPTALTGQVVGSSQVYLLWTASTDSAGVASYKIYRNGIVAAALGNVTSFSDTGLAASTLYTYAVSACDTWQNCSAQSSPISLTTSVGPDVQPPTVPTGLSATVVSSTNILLNWNASTDNVGVTTYRIYSSRGLVETLGNVTSSLRTNAPSTTYSYTVSACDAVGNCSAQSAPVLATTPAAPAINIGFVPGWNLAGNGVETPMMVAATFNDATKVNAVWKWVPGSAKWAFYTPTQSDGGASYASSNGYNVLTTINAGEGFWVQANSAFSMPLPSGAVVLSSTFMPAVANPATAGGTHALPSGWSLIAIGDGMTPAQFDAAIATVNSTLPKTTLVYTNLTTLWAWDATRQNWYFWAPALANSGGLASYISSRNYLDSATMPSTPTGTLSPTTGFWVNMP